MPVSVIANRVLVYLFGNDVTNVRYKPQVDEQLCWCRKYEAFYFIFDIHVVLLCIFAITIGLELLLVRR